MYRPLALLYVTRLNFRLLILLARGISSLVCILSYIFYFIPGLAFSFFSIYISVILLLVQVLLLSFHVSHSLSCFLTLILFISLASVFPLYIHMYVSFKRVRSIFVVVVDTRLHYCRFS
jgi:hypothetical protein